MFKKDESKPDEIETIIGPSVQIEGSFVANGDMIIEGTVSGSIKTERNLKIGPKAKIFANIYATNALIAGEVQGNIKIKENLELTDSAKIFGDIKTKILSMAPGAGLHGKCMVGEDKKIKLEKADSKEKLANIKLPPVSEKVK